MKSVRFLTSVWRDSIRPGRNIRLKRAQSRAESKTEPFCYFWTVRTQQCGNGRKKDFWRDFYEFPNFDGVLSEQEALEEAEKIRRDAASYSGIAAVQAHFFSHVEWHITGYAIKIAGNDVEQEGEEKAGLIFADAKTAAERYAIPSAFAEYAKYTDLERA